MQNLDKLLDAIIADYSKMYDGPRASEYGTKQIRLMREGKTLTVEAGQKYLKVIHGNSVWGFVVNVHDDKQFKYGDILLPKSWKGPQRNKARGNVVEGDFSSVKWTGPMYLI